MLLRPGNRVNFPKHRPHQPNRRRCCWSRSVTPLPHCTATCTTRRMPSERPIRLGFDVPPPGAVGVRRRRPSGIATVMIRRRLVARLPPRPGRGAGRRPRCCAGAGAVAVAARITAVLAGRRPRAGRRPLWCWCSAPAPATGRRAGRRPAAALAGRGAPAVLVAGGDRTGAVLAGGVRAGSPRCWPAAAVAAVLLVDVDLSPVTLVGALGKSQTGCSDMISVQPETVGYLHACYP